MGKVRQIAEGVRDGLLLACTIIGAAFLVVLIVGLLSGSGSAGE